MGNLLACCCRRSHARGDADLYALLDVAPTATRDEIDAAMRRLTDAHGPGSGGDAKLLEQATNAYAVLSDPQRRARYDAILKEEPSAYTSYSGKPRSCGTSGVPGPYDAGGISTAVEWDGGFRAAETTYGLWNEPPLQLNRLPSEELTLLRSLSAGAFGDVWLGQLGDAQVAIKQLKRENQIQSKVLTFAIEIVRMTQLLHPKITTFVGVEWTKPCATRVVAEYLPRGDLRTLLRSPQAKELTWADFKCQVAMDVVDALAYLQTAKGVMESFTSRNVLLENEDGSCKLSVFVAARGRLDLLSNPHYSGWMAPEILLGEGDGDPAKSSIYSLGVLLCELDTTKPPFYDAFNPDGSPMSSYKIAQLVTLGTLRPSVSEECPEGIASLVSECLAFDPHARPTAASIAYRLRDVLKNEL